MKKISAFMLICSNLLAMYAYAMPCLVGSRANALTFTVGSGPYFFDSSRRLNNTDVTFAALGYDFTEHWGIEASLGFFNTTFKDGFDNDKQNNGTLITVDGLYHFSPYRFVEPYVSAGVGVLGLSSNRTDANNEGNVNAGVGIQMFANSAVAFRVEAKDLYTIVGGKNDFFVNAGVTFFLDLC